MSASKTPPQWLGMGREIFPATGDNRRPAEAVAKTLGIDAVEAAVEPQRTPAAKSEVVNSWGKHPIESRRPNR